jgi:hypothetical protein
MIKITKDQDEYTKKCFMCDIEVNHIKRYKLEIRREYDNICHGHFPYICHFCYDELKQIFKDIILK